MSSISAALVGFDQAQTQFSNAAQALSTSALPSEGSDADVMDLSAKMVAMISARNAVAVTAKVLHTADDLAHNVIDLLG